MYDEDLVNRLRELLAPEKNVDEKRMFGGLAFLINGNMAVAASGHGGWVRVGDDGVRTTRQLTSWLTIGVNYAKSLPSK